MRFCHLEALRRSLAAIGLTCGRRRQNRCARFVRDALVPHEDVEARTFKLLKPLAGAAALAILVSRGSLGWWQGATQRCGPALRDHLLQGVPYASWPFRSI